MLHQLRQVVVADLVTEAPGAAVDHDGHLADFDPQGRGHVPVEDLLDDLHLEKMVAGAQRADLVLAPLEGPFAHRLRIGPRQTPPVLHGLQVALGAVAVFHRPAGTLDKDPLLLAAGEFQSPPGADA